MFDQKSYQKDYFQKHKEEILKSNADWAKNNVDKMRAYRKKWELANPEKISASRANRAKHIKEYQSEYGRKNRKKITAKQNRRINTDPQLKIAKNLRNRLLRALKGDFKTGSAVRDLGCSIEFLKTYLESQFKSGMGWDNYGRDGWHIDHILPVSMFDLKDQAQLRQVCNYKNLQPLWAAENIIKRNKRN